MSTETKTVAQYKALGGAIVTIAEQSGVYWVEHPTEHGVHCNGCGEEHTEGWGFDAHHDEFGTGPQPNFDATGGEYALPAARRWAQAHAEVCRARPPPSTHGAAASLPGDRPPRAHPSRDRTTIMALLARLTAVLRFTQQELPYCARCGGHYPAHSH